MTVSQRTMLAGCLASCLAAALAATTPAAAADNPLYDNGSAYVSAPYADEPYVTGPYVTEPAFIVVPDYAGEVGAYPLADDEAAVVAVPAYGAGLYPVQYYGGYGNGYASKQQAKRYWKYRQRQQVYGGRGYRNQGYYGNPGYGQHGYPGYRQY